ncbi:type II 3-dehydroquinate dehydratase [Citricoccus sp. NPDC079358]|uniref:type II 3-dehydroquinate dehydratase n=1 Tax=Citricoccus sp. NPDC079358 TaxID=3154653 RepID=UPI00344EE675
MTKPLFVLNGPNLNLLGQREPDKYGTTTLADVQVLCEQAAAGQGLTVDFRQSNHEGTLVDWIQEARAEASGIILNPAGYTTTSIAIMDALLAAEVPLVEVHVTNIHQREEFRHHSYVSKVANAVIAGAGVHGYELAVQHLARLVRA